MPAFEMPRNAITLVPATDFSAKQYTFVTVDASGNMVTPAAGARAIGVAQMPAIAKEPCTVEVSGVSFIKLGAAVNAGQEVETNASGQAIPLNTGKSCGICVFGGASGAIASILVR